MTQHHDTPGNTRSGILGQLDSQQFSLTEAVGGWRGMVESVVPSLVFVVTYVVTTQLRLSLVVTGVVAALLCLARLIQRQNMTQALSGAIAGIGIGALWAWTSGRGQDFFIGGLISAAVFSSVMLISLLVRRPLIGVALQVVYSLPRTWWSDTDSTHVSLRARAWAATWVWAAVFILRLAIQYPLWYAGMVAQLGVAKLILGLPLFGLGAWITWLLIAPELTALRNRRN
ncbi:DUF3159 domain-containing protein [Schaalia suimastitidis]|uniref:DUF3159 domain-containing protein n=1 Tax=Schaalia suimastitidis TaxID=121163 RepID=UPI00041491DB|nr:DUF3159 domain-containing protein [Schaalia suimastitidis]